MVLRPKSCHRQRNHPNQRNVSVSSRDTFTLAADSPVLALFKDAALKLNERQDRHERLVKLSRDITIESKRIIFLLHSAINDSTTQKVLIEANERLQKLIHGPIKSIGIELQNTAAYLHSRAVTNGFQEFVEAYTLWSLMERKDIIKWKDLQKALNYTIKENDNDIEIVTMLPQIDYMLGIADLTGELMRKTINSISSGDSEECCFICQIIRDLFCGFLGLVGGGNELARKLSTTRNNVSKVESAVYALRVRGGEAPSSLLLPPPGPPPADWDNNNTNHSDDEGYF